MRRRHGWVAAFGTLGFVALLAAQAQEAGKADKALQGTWTADHKGKKLSVSFEESNFTFKIEDAEVNGTFTVDQARKPRTMDLAVTGGRGEPADRYAGKTAKAIYELDGEMLKWAANEPGKDERPEAFPDNPGEGQHLYVVFKREKK